jgi:phosphatidylserine decarboxylase
MKLHKESKGTITVATILFVILGALAIYFLKIWSLIIILPLLVIYSLVFWFFRVPIVNFRSQRKCDRSCRRKSGNDKEVKRMNL